MSLQKGTVASVLTGYLLNWGLYGVLSVQVYTYHIGFPNDRLLIKTLVYGVYLIEILQTGLTTYQAYSTACFGEYTLHVLGVARLCWFSGPILGAIVAFIGQSFYAYRIYILSPSKYISYVVASVALLQCIAGIICGVTSVTDPQLKLVIGYTRNHDLLGRPFCNL